MKYIFMILLFLLVFLTACQQQKAPVDVNIETSTSPSLEQIPCDEPHPENCIQLYEPVCGSDGTTYSNGCSACQQKRVEWYTEGEC